MSTSATIDELLLRWQELRLRGPFPSVRELCADRPELVEELERRIAAFESMEAMLGMESAATRTDPGAPHGVPPHLADKLRPLGYELLEVIDQGGMGVVYKAVQVKLRRVVALKMIAGYRAGPRQLARFRTEAEAVARLQHPHIVQIHEVGEVDGHSFFSMEYVEGGTLAGRLANDSLSPPDAAALLETLARAVHHAHTRGIVHRDLKPSNILLAGDRRQETGDSGKPEAAPLSPVSCLLSPKVSDFGLAKQLGADAGHTTTGEVIGTPAYMAPEQAEGKTDVGPACDVYALGAILYEALTGRPPFKANTVLETLRQVISQEPPAPRRVRPEVPPDLEAVCLRCLEKHPKHRYATAEALADDLKRFLAGRPVAARPLSVTARTLRWARRHRFVAGAVLLALVGALVAGAVVAGQGYVERERVRKRAAELAPQAREILHRHCFQCHGENPAKAERKFLVLDRASLLDPHRRNVVPGRPADSRLIQRIEDGTMPPEDNDLHLPRVSELELEILKEWIAGGAPDFPAVDPASPTPPVVPNDPLAAQAKAVFVGHCYHCHRVAEAGGGIRILNHPLLVSQRKVVIPGKPDESELYQLLVTTDENLMMPPQTEPRLAPEEIAAVRRWIEAGAPPFTRTPK